MSIPTTPQQARQSHLESEAWRRALVWGLRHLPVPLQRASMPLWSAFFYVQVPHVRRAIESNLHRLLRLRSPRLQAMAYRTFTNYCHTVASGYLSYLGIDPQLPVQLQGADRLRQVLAQHGAAIIATGHVGSWQLGAQLLQAHDFPPVTVVMTEEPDQQTQRYVARLRDGAVRVAYGGRSSLLGLELRAALKRGELVAFQMDRPGPGGGLQVPFADGRATFASGPGLLARACGVPVVPVFFPVVRRALQVTVAAPLVAPAGADRRGDVAQLTARLARVYEQQVRRTPEQWFNFYSFWSDR